MKTVNPLDLKKLFFATVAAVITNLVLFFLGSALGATWDVGQPVSVGIGLVLIATIVPLLVGGLVVKLISSRWPRSQNWFAWGVLIFAIVGSPMGWISSGDAATGISLGLMHVVEGLAWFFAVRTATTSKNIKE